MKRLSLILCVVAASACGACNPCGKKAAPKAATNLRATPPPTQMGATPGKAPPVVNDGMVPDIILPGARFVEEGVLVGGQPSRGQLAQAKAQGYTIVVNMRPGTEPGVAQSIETVKALGLESVHLPVVGRADLGPELAHELDQILQRRGDGKVLIHCSNGNRVGAAFAMKAYYIDGIPAQLAFENGLRAGLTSMRLEVGEHLAAIESGVNPHTGQVLGEIDYGTPAH